MGPAFDLPRRDAWSWLRVAALCVVSAFVCIAHYGWWTADAWRQPTNYSGDALEMLARIKAASEGDTIPLLPQRISRLGAPFGADWNDYPASDKVLVLALGAVARAIGPIPASNVGLVLAQVSAALAFYFAMRLLRRRWEWAFAGALLFAYGYHTFSRGLGHMMLTFTWTVPLGVLACWLVARSRRLHWRNAAGATCLVAAVALGVSMPYYLFFFLQLLFWALVAQWFGDRRRENLRTGLVCLALALAAFFAVHAEVWLHSAESGARPLLARNFAGTERYALKLVEMVTPPADHRSGLFSFMGNRYGRWVDWRGEPLFPYLGLVGIAGLVWLLLASLRRVFRNRAPSGDFLQVWWLFGYTTVGGLTSVAALYLGLQIFRASNRVTVFILAIVLAFLVGRLSRLTVRWPAWARLGAAFALAALGLFDQVPRPLPAATRQVIADRVAMDAAFARELEQALPAGAMIYQLPAMPFPEIVPPHRMEDYEHFRTYVHSETLRFSYGAPKYRAVSRWQRDLDDLPLGEVIDRLESYGFAALHINRSGFEDRAEDLLAELAAIKDVRTLESSNRNQVVVLLSPHARPVPPLADTLTLGDGWQTWSPRPGRVYDRSVRWSYADATLGYHNPYKAPIRASLALTLSGAGSRDIEVSLNGRRVFGGAFTEEAQALPVLELTLQPGYNRFDFRSPQPPARVGNVRSEPKVAIGLREMQLTIDRASLPSS